MTVMENEYLRVSVSEHGAELTSVYDKQRQQEDIWTADPAYWARHAPVLFPFVGKVNGGRYRYRGKEYEMGQHGFARDLDFRFVDASEGEVTYELTDTPETKASYPFSFRLQVAYHLDGRTLQVHWQVFNPSEREPLYFSIGAHPAFNWPSAAFPDKSSYTVDFGRDRLEYVLIDPSTASVDWQHPSELVLPGGKLALTPDLFDRDALIFDGGQISRAVLCYPDGSPYVTMDCAGFPSFGLWSKPHADAPYVCLEPWIGRCDNMGFQGELPEKFGEQELTPRKTFEASFSLNFS